MTRALEWAGADVQSAGEIDIVEFTNNGPRNLMALHTLPGCSIAGSGMTGQLDYNDCNVSTPTPIDRDQQLI